LVFQSFIDKVILEIPTTSDASELKKDRDEVLCGYMSILKSYFKENPTAKSIGGPSLINKIFDFTVVLPDKSLENLNV